MNAGGRSSLLVVPTYNEASGIEDLIDQALAAVPGLDILVVDDNSPDGTGELVAKRAEFEPRLRLLSRPSKQGLGRAYIAGFRRGLSDEYDRFIEMDADLSHDPRDLARLIRAAGEADLVIGSRYVAGGSVEGWSRGRHALSAAANRYAQVMLGHHIKDSTSGFRCYRREVLEMLDLDSISSQGYAFQVEMAFRASQAGFRVKEIPIAFRERRTGASKMSKQIVLEGMIWVTRAGLKNRAGRFRRRR
ncbi:polyprenol monophosphomannose synthase [soil metagenome]